jgi:hypothetical protein
VEELQQVNLAKSLVTFLSLSQILFLILYHRLPTGVENTVLSLSDSLPRPVPQAPNR